MTLPDEPLINLNPSEAAMSPPGFIPPRVGAIVAEKTGGTEMATFRIPLHLKAVVTAIVNDERFGFNGNLSHFYLQALGTMVLYFDRFFRGEDVVTSYASALRRLDETLALQEPIEAFRDRLDQAEKRAELFRAGKSFDNGLALLQEAVRFVESHEDPAHTALAGMLRRSKPMQELCQMLVQDETWGLAPEVDGLQRWMAGGE